MEHEAKVIHLSISSRLLNYDKSKQLGPGRAQAPASDIQWACLHKRDERLKPFLSVSIDRCKRCFGQQTEPASTKSALDRLLEAGGVPPKSHRVILKPSNPCELACCVCKMDGISTKKN